jgi:GNAT superfamily N-acetyltransferase
MTATPPDSVVIAPAVPADAAEIVRMARELAHHQRDPASRFDSAAAAEDLFGNPPWLFGVVARLDGKARAMALWHRAYETSFAARGAYIVSLWVDPPLRRLGIATRLVAAVAARIKREGGSFIWWASKPWNSPAHATYASLGAGEEPVMAHALFGDRFEAIAALDQKETATT